MSNEQLPNNDLTQKIDEPLNSSTPPVQPIPQNKTPQLSSPHESKTLKIILGIATIFPLFVLATSSLYSKSVGVGLLLIFLLITFWENILDFIYILILFNNRRISKNRKYLWGILFTSGILSAIISPTINLIKNDIFLNLTDYLGSLAFISYIAMPLFWYFYIWKEPKKN